MNYNFKIDMSVRSYECDPQGIVNNAVYLQYLEYARGEWLKTMGLSYSKLIKLKQYLVISEIKMKFKHSLVCDDTFYVAAKVWRESNIRISAHQDIYRSDNKLILLSKVEVVGIDASGKFNLPSNILDTYPMVSGEV
jgi:acyl-CoA thioester hydrolase